MTTAQALTAHAQLEYSLSREVCVLSVEEAARFEHWSVWPSCRKCHHHIKVREAEAMIAAETHRYVGGNDTTMKDAGKVSMIVPVETGKMWVPVPAGNSDGSRLMGMRTWGLARSR